MDGRAWNQFVREHGPRSGAFLQSWGWGNFQESLGRKIERVEHEGPRWQAQVRKVEVGFGLRYWYCGRGPIGEETNNKSQITNDIEELKKHFHGATFLRFDFPQEISSFPSFPLSSFHSAPHDVQPRTTILLDLKKSIEALLKEMHHKTRYNIGVAKKKGVTVKLGGEELFELFWQMLESTTDRNAFRSHPKSYYQKMLTGYQDPDLKIFLALSEVDGQPAAAAIVCDFGGVRTYLHGSSNYALRDVMAPYALHWQLIQEGKQRGLTRYDFWGIASSDDPKERLAGVTRFKKGWGGEVVGYPKAQDLVFRPVSYAFYRLLNRLFSR